MQGLFKVGSATPLHKTPGYGDCCALNWEAAQGRWEIDGLRIMNVRTERPTASGAGRKPYAALLSHPGRCSLCQQGTGWSQIWNLWAVWFSADAVCGCLCMPPALGINYRPTEVVPDRTSWLQPFCSWRSQNQSGKDKAGEEVALRILWDIWLQCQNFSNRIK